MEESYDPIPNLPDNRLSFSKIKTWTFCHYKFFLQYVDKAKGLVRIPRLLGSNWHLGQEHGIKTMIESHTPKTKEVVEVAVESLKIDLRKRWALDFDDFNRNKKDAKDDLKKMAAHGFEQIVKTFRPLTSEKTFEFDLDSETTVAGRIDVTEFIQDEGEGITEMKTTTRQPRDLIVFDAQTSIYQSWKTSVKWLKKFFLIRHTDAARNVSVVVLKKQADSPEWIASIISDLKKIKQQMLTASMYGYDKTADLQTCSWCDFRRGCRPELFNHEDNVGKIISKEILFSTDPKKQGDKKYEYDPRPWNQDGGANQLGRIDTENKGRSSDDNRKSYTLPDSFK